MSLCPKCGRAMCDHTLEERGQTYEEMMRDLTPGERRAFQISPSDCREKIELAKRNAHLPVPQAKPRQRRR